MVRVSRVIRFLLGFSRVIRFLIRVSVVRVSRVVRVISSAIGA